MRGGAVAIGTRQPAGFRWEEKFCRVERDEMRIEEWGCSRIVLLSRFASASASASASAASAGFLYVIMYVMIIVIVMVIHLADPQFLPIAPLPLRLLQLALAVGETDFVLGRPGRGGGGRGQITRRVSRRGSAGERW